MDHLGLSSRLRQVLFSEFRNYSEQLYFVTDFYPDRFHPVASLWFCFGKQKPQCDDWQVASLPELGLGGSWSTCWDAKSDEFLFAVFTWSSYCGLPRLVEDSFGAYSILYNRELSFTMVEIPIDQPISYGIIPINQAVFHGMMAFGRGSHCSPVFSSRHQWLQLGATAGCCTCPVSIQAGGCPAK